MSESGSWVNQELIDFFLAGGPAVQSACLDGLLAIMLDSSTNQKVSVLLPNIHSPHFTGVHAKELFHMMRIMVWQLLANTSLQIPYRVCYSNTEFLNRFRLFTNLCVSIPAQAPQCWFEHFHNWYGVNIDWEHKDYAGTHPSDLRALFYGLSSGTCEFMWCIYMKFQELIEDDHRLPKRLLLQQEFERVHGLRKIADMLRNSHLDPGIRWRLTTRRVLFFHLKFWWEFWALSLSISLPWSLPLMLHDIVSYPIVNFEWSNWCNLVEYLVSLCGE